MSYKGNEIGKKQNKTKTLTDKNSNKQEIQQGAFSHKANTLAGRDR